MKPSESLKKLFTRRKKAVTNDYLLGIYKSLATLEDKKLIEINYDRPFIFVSHQAYDCWCCSGVRQYDEKKASEFLYKIRLYINFVRAGMGRKEYVADDTMISFAVGGEVEDSVILVGQCRKNEVRILMS